uniref:EF-hand domain-containing protein n=1 Tax=Alexandrium catenella TaxID=2925 RepID=A0A7S1PNH7_ALECA
MAGNPLMTSLMALCASLLFVGAYEVDRGEDGEACGLLDAGPAPAAGSSMLQSRAGGMAGAVVEEEAREGSKGGYDVVTAKEALADTNLLGLGVEVDHGQITQDAWMRAFRRLDVNSLGSIKVKDLVKSESEIPKEPRNLTSRNWNLTRAQIKRGMALCVSMFPKHAWRLIAHEAAVAEFAVKGELPPDDMPDPEDPLAGLEVPSVAEIAQRNVNALQRSSMALSLPVPSAACMTYLIKTIVAVLEFLVGLAGLKAPDGTLVASMATKNIAFLADVSHYCAIITAAKKPYNMAFAIKGIFMSMYAGGIFQAAVEKTFDGMSWWKAAVMMTQVATIVSTWFATGSSMFITQIILSIFRARRVIKGSLGVARDCRAANAENAEGEALAEEEEEEE